MVSVAKRPARLGSERSTHSASRQFSLAHLTLLGLAPPELAEIAGKAGYDFVSLRIIPLGLPGEPRYALGHDPGLFRRTQAALQTHGVRVLDIELARIYEGVDIRSYLPAMEAGARLGARHLLTSAWCPDRTFVLERFIELCNLAAPLGLTVDFEFVTFASYRTLADAAELVRASACDNAGICIDTLHFDRSECMTTDPARLPRGWFHYAQICDGPANYAVDDASLRSVAREGRLYVGEGGIDVPSILASMPAAMPCSIELPNSERLKELGPAEFARRCLATARESLEHSALQPVAA